jgi:hypothetical protein
VYRTPVSPSSNAISADVFDDHGQSGTPASSYPMRSFSSAFVEDGKTAIPFPDPPHFVAERIIAAARPFARANSQSLRLGECRLLGCADITPSATAPTMRKKPMSTPPGESSYSA